MKVADVYLEQEPWSITERGFSSERSRVSEALFSLANEYMGVRGYFDETYSGDSLVGSYVNGVFEETFPLDAGGYKGVSNRVAFMVNTVNWLHSQISIDGETLDLAKVNFSDFARTLDFTSGLYRRSFVWITNSGSKILVQFERQLSMVHSTKGFQRIRLLALEGQKAGAIKATIKLALDFSALHESYEKNYWRCSDHKTGESSAQIMGTSINLGQKLLARMDLSSNSELRWKPVPFEKGVALETVVAIGPQETIVDREVDLLHHQHLQQFIEDPSRFAPVGFDRCHQENSQYWKKVWERSDIKIEGDDANQQGIRFSIFQMEQTYRAAAVGSNIGAKGLTGEFYNGNAFWDTEVYCLPYYLFSNPQAARQLLDYRYATLPQALDRAKDLDCEGACFPIATSDGTESCTLWQHASCQLQPTTAVAYALWHYMKVTGDWDFMATKGLEMLLQIGRFLVTRVQYSEGKKAYGYYGVMGPDEFQMMVNHNAYTNYMGKRSLQWILEAVAEMEQKYPRLMDEISAKIGFQTDELLKFRNVAEKMYIPMDQEGKIFEQHEGYFDLPHVDVDAIPVEEFPLYHHWSYDRIYRNDMIKQPDVLMFMLLYNQSFSFDQLKANYEYYEPRTIHESSLSPSVHSILAAQLGKDREALDFFGFATRIDLDNYNRNTREGLHMTAISAAWMNIVYGFGGFRSDGPIPVLNPKLPPGWKGYSFSLTYAGSRISVLVDQEGSKLNLVDGPEIQIQIGGTTKTLAKDRELVH